MKTPDEIKKGLECCNTYNDCQQCSYDKADGSWACTVERNADVLAYIQRLEQREWEVFDLLSSAWHGKQYYFKQKNGSVYSRESCDYITFDRAIDEFAHALTVAEDINVPTQPKWISVEERLPEDGQRVVGICKNGMTGIMDYKDDGTPFAARIFGVYFSNITHWMPMPEPPKEVP